MPLYRAIVDRYPYNYVSGLWFWAEDKAKADVKVKDMFGDTAKCEEGIYSSSKKD